MNAIKLGCLQSLSAIALLAVMSASVRAQVSPVVSADIGRVPADVALPPKIDVGLASRTIRERTLPTLWKEQGDLSAMRRILADPVKRAHAVGHLAEDDFVDRNPAWRKTAAANAPENDVWRWRNGKLEGGQIKTHANGDPAAYLRDMFRDAKAESFFVPDDHVGSLVQKIRQQLSRAEAGGNERIAITWARQLRRVQPLGRTYGQLDGGAIASARRTIRWAAARGAGDMAALSLAIDGTMICYRCANGELTPAQTEEAALEAGTKAAVVGTATYAVVLLGANPVGITVIVVGGVAYFLADYVIEELRPSFASSPMTLAEIDQVMPIGWWRDEP